MTENWPGLKQGVRLIEVSVKRELTVLEDGMEKRHALNT